MRFRRRQKDTDVGFPAAWSRRDLIQLASKKGREMNETKPRVLKVLDNLKVGDVLSNDEAVARVQRILNIPEWDGAAASARLSELVFAGLLERTYDEHGQITYLRTTREWTPRDMAPKSSVIHEWIPEHVVARKVVVDGVELMGHVVIPERTIER
jgi:hypothetical protein